MGRQTGQQRETVALRCLEWDIAYRKRQVYRADSSDSTVLWDHKAFLFDEQKQLLALPVSMNSFVIRDEQYSKGYWQGAYIFAVASEQDFSLRGTITHQDDGTQFESGLHVKRILYIEEVLYTVSDKIIKMNSLEDLTDIREIEIP